MRPGRSLAAAALLTLSLPCLAAGHAHRGPTSQRLFHKRAVRASARPASQRVMDDSRAAEIQTALAGAGYLDGEPSGHWDSNTASAMQRYQADHGWQTKLIPDSRAIIKLGLGPKQTSSVLGDSALSASTFSASAPASSPLPSLR